MHGYTDVLPQLHLISHLQDVNTHIVFYFVSMYSPVNCCDFLRYPTTVWQNTETFHAFFQTVFSNGVKWCSMEYYM